MLSIRHALIPFLFAVCAGAAHATGYLPTAAIKLPPVSPQQVQETASLPAPAGLNRGVPAQRRQTRGAPLPKRAMPSAAQASGAASPLGELARALRNDPDLIYEYVRNNIQYQAVWGVQKGAFGAMVEQRGTAFDQASLMVALLREAGYPSARYVSGRIKLSPAQLGNWLGVSTASSCAVTSLLAQGQIPVHGNCTPNAALGATSISHVWVKVEIGGIAYVFDPSFKPHTVKAGIDLAGVLGYSQANHLSRALFGATETPDFVQGMNRAAIHASLTGYASNLATLLRTYLPAASLVDVVGGKTIDPHLGGALRQVALPHQDTSVGVVEWNEIAPGFSPTLRVRYAGINEIYSADALYGRRLTLSYEATTNIPVLKLDGVEKARGSVVSPGTFGDVTFTITHAMYSLLAQRSTNITFTRSIRAGGTYLIANAWGATGRELVEYYRNRQETDRAAGNSDGSEPVLGSGLALLAATWSAQTSAANLLIDRVARTNTTAHHMVGIAGYDRSAYVDLPANFVTITSETGNLASENGALFASLMHASVLESTAVHQSTGVNAVSTIKLLDIAAAGNQPIFDARLANYLSIVPRLGACDRYLLGFYSAVTAGQRLILPGRCDLRDDNWSGVGYLNIDATRRSMGALIDGALVGEGLTGGAIAGGFGSRTQPVAQFSSNTVLNMPSPLGSLTQTTGATFNDPIDMAKGNYLYTRDDIRVGIGAFPHALSFQSLYSSGRRLQDGPMGRGWTHNLALSASPGSDGFQAMGEDSALDAVGAIAATVVAVDLLSDQTAPLKKVVAAALGARWFSDQLTGNTVVVRQGLDGNVFVRLADGSYNPPQGSSALLTRKADGGYRQEAADRTRLDFASDGKLTSYSHPSGIEVRFGYVGKDLQTVSNSLGRILRIAYKNERISEVGDGEGHAVHYDQDPVSGELKTFTDALGASTRFEYDLPARLVRLFYPANPGNAFVHNVYDSQDKVQTQDNAYGKRYTYYFAGSRSEEIDPLGGSNVSYLDRAGRRLRMIDPLRRTTQNRFDGHGRVVRTELPEGNASEYVYDDATCASAERRCTHNVKTVTRLPKPGSALPALASSFSYESKFNKMQDATDARGKRTDYTYTAQGEPWTVVEPPDAAGARPTTTLGYLPYSAAGFPPFYLLDTEKRLITTARATTTRHTYDTTNRYAPKTTVVDDGGLNLTSLYLFDGVGNLTFVDGPRQDVTDTTGYGYDLERRLERTSDALGGLVRFAYDLDGRLVRTAARSGTQWLLSCRYYGLSGKLKHAWGPLTAASEVCPAPVAPVPLTDYAYDELDRPQRVTVHLPAAEGGNRVAETDYFGDGSVRAQRRAVGTGLAQTYAAYTYQRNGQVATVRDANNNVTTFTYDGHGRREKTIFPDKENGATASASDFEQYGYDANGNLTTLRKRDGKSVTNIYDNLNRLTGRIYPLAADNVSYGLDLLGRRVAASSAGHALKYEFDNAGRLESESAGTRKLSYQYDAAGNRTRITWPDGFFATYGYDALNRPTAIKEKDVVSLVAEYGYDALSRRTTVLLANATKTTYGYGAQGVLASLTHDMAGAGQDLRFDYGANQAGEVANHSWNGPTWRGARNGSRSAVANGLNQYTSVAGVVLKHDANGNLTGDGAWTYGYDLDDQLTSASATGVAAALKYDAAGRLRSTAINNITTELLYDGTDLVAEYDLAGKLLRRYVHGPGIDEPVVWYDGAGASKTWMYADHLGSVIATADAAGKVSASLTYGPWGEPDTSTGPRFRYTGQQLLGPLNLYYYKARMYSPALGRFLQTDPVGDAADINLYAYVANDPINATDPNGECPWCIGAIIGGGIDLGFQLYSNGGEFSQVNWTNVGISAGLGAVGNIAGGKAAGYLLGKANNMTKGRIGEAAAALKGMVHGRVPVAFQVKQTLSKSHTIVDQVQVSLLNGKKLFVEAKFGTGTLTTPQRLASRELDNYVVTRTSAAEVAGAARMAGSIAGGTVGSASK